MNTCFRLGQDQQILLRLLRRAIGKDRDSSPLRMSQAEWLNLFMFAREHDVAGLLLPAVHESDTDIPRQVKRQWSLYSVNVQAQYKTQLDALIHLTDILRSHGIRTMVLKGLGLALCYPEPSLRESGDVDIWCPGEYDKVNSIVEDLGISIETDDEKHCMFRVSGVEIENHRKFNYDINTHNRVIGDALESIMSSEPLTDSSLPGVLLPNPTANTLYLMTHLLNHQAWSGITLRNLLDWTLFLDRYHDRIDWTYVVSIWEKAGILHAVSLVHSICRDILGCMEVELIPLAQSEDPRYAFLLFDLFNPVQSSSATNNILLKVRNRYLLHLRRKERHRTIYNEPFPDSLLKSILGNSRISRLVGL